MDGPLSQFDGGRLTPLSGRGELQLDPLLPGGGGSLRPQLLLAGALAALWGGLSLAPARPARALEGAPTYQRLTPATLEAADAEWAAVVEDRLLVTGAAPDGVEEEGLAALLEAAGRDGLEVVEGGDAGPGWAQGEGGADESDQ